MNDVTEWDDFNLVVELNRYQDWTATTAKYPRHKGVEYCALGLTSEAGEVCDKIKKAIRDGHAPDIQGITKELGDVVWYVARLADELGVDLGKVFVGNKLKLNDRKERNVLGGSGDER